MFGTNFGPLDWVVVIVYLVGAGVVGIYVNRYIHNVGDYMVGGRAAGTSLNVATFIGTGLGLVTVMYASIDAFNRGFSYLALPVINVIGALIIGTTGFVIKRLRAWLCEFLRDVPIRCPAGSGSVEGVVREVKRGERRGA